MDFSTIAGVKDRWYDRILIVEWDESANQCAVISDDGLHTRVISRSSILSSDDSIRACCSEIGSYISTVEADALRGAVESAMVRGLFNQRRAGSNVDASFNEQLQLPTASGSDGRAGTVQAGDVHAPVYLTNISSGNPPIPVDGLG